MTPARQLARRTARRVAPGYMADRARRYERAVRLRAGATCAAQQLVAGTEPVVRAGPFAGLRYPADRLADIDAAVPKLLGTYEQEIAWVFARAISRGVSTFVDIGCADGYYAAGMAHACSATTIYAFDLAASARELCAQTAAASDVGNRVQIAKRFTLNAFDFVRSRGALVLCDIEGGEVELFSPGAVARLADTLVVIEVHEDDRPGAGAHLESVFAHSHDATRVGQGPRVEIPPAVASWPAHQQATALREFRGPQLHWLVLEPKTERRRG